MKAGIAQLQNRGMSRDMSVSKAENTFAFENRNVRILADGKDTQLSVTNERGNKKIENLSFEGTLIGWNVLNSYIILFTSDNTTDRIYRVHYDAGSDSFTSILIFEGSLNFSTKNPIESIVDFENEDIQKIYWVDGRNVLRFMNFADANLEDHLTSGTLEDSPVFDFSDDSTWFDSNRPGLSGFSVTIKKDNSGNERANGTVQYFITYYNKNGQETNWVYVSPLVYLAPDGRGGEADGHNFNRITLKIASSECDQTFDYMRLYALVTTSYNLTRQAYLVSEAEIKTDVSNYTITLIDDGRYLSTVDSSSLLFLGSREVYPGTMAHKDGTLFMGDFNLAGNADLAEIREAIAKLHNATTGESSVIHFEYTDNENDDIPYVQPDGYYPYKSQLKYLNSQITTFKGGEKYRFAVRFRKDNGETTPAFWLGDKTNTLYPKMIANGSTIHRVIVRCTLPQEVIDAAKDYAYAQLMIAQATYADRAVKAQGIVNPTVFNLYERYFDEPFAQASWFYRPVYGNAAYEHFEATAKSDTADAELQCSWWEEKETDGNDSDEYNEATDTEETYLPSPLYYRDEDGKIANPPYGYTEYNWCRQKITCYSRKGAFTVDGVPYAWVVQYWAKLTIELAYTEDGSEPDIDNLGENDKYVKYEFNLGSKTALWNKGKNKVVSDYLNACKDVDYPVTERWSSDDVSSWCVKARQNAKVWPGRKGKYTKDSGWTLVKYSDLNYGSKFSEYNREYFFVDNSIVTLNSPEIEYEKVNLDRMDGLKFRIVGAVRLTSNITDYDLSTENHKYSGDTLIRKNFSHKNLSDRVSGLLTFPLYFENGLKLKDHGDDKCANNHSLSDPDTHTSDCYEFDSGKKHYLIYPFQKSGSLIGYTTTDDDEASQTWDKITTKKIANLHFGYYTEYSDNPLELEKNDIRQFTALTNQVYELNTIYGTKIYGANISDMILMPGTCKYPVLSSDEDTAVDNPLSAEVDNESTIYSDDPVPLSYKSNAHAVIALSTETKSNDEGEKTILQKVLPVLYKDDDSETNGDEDTVENDGPYCPWLDGELGANARYIIYKSSGDKSLKPEETEDSGGSYGPAMALFYDDTGTATFWGMDLFPATMYDAITEAKKKTNSSIYAFIGVTQDGTDDWQREYYLADITNIQRTEANVRFYMALVPDEDDQTSGHTYIGFVATNSYGYEIYGYSVTITDKNGRQFSSGKTLDEQSESISGEYNADAGGLESQNNSELSIELSIKYIYGDGEILESKAKATLSFDNSDVKVTSDNYYVIDGVDYMKVAGTENMTLYNIYDSKYYTFNGNDFTVDETKVTSYSGYSQNVLDMPHELVKQDDPYLLVGELYLDYDDPEDDKRYGGISEADIESNTFIPAGQMTVLGEELIGNEGDTYFQRWDSVKTLPMGDDETNQVIDIASVMLETHVNIEGRTDIDRGSTRLCDIDYDSFGKLNDVYSQEDNFLSSVNTDEMQDIDLYRTSISWSLEKHAGEEVDNWTHVTLNSSINLDGDKGIVRALRRYNNSLLAFQDHAICEVLFNSRTQVATTNDVPIEIANSGKVDGKRYITNKYGCRNKWSIVEGKSGLYFIDDLNRLICNVGEGIDALSTKARLGAWVKDRLDGVLHEESWTPDVSGQQFISFYDTEHSDVYFVKWNDTVSPCLVYSETLGAFTGFFDYSMMPMLANVQDRLVSFRDGNLWLQHEGYYGRFFGADYPFWMTFRVNSENGYDAIWTGVDYHADFMQVLDENGDLAVGEDDYSGEDQLDNYMPDMTFEKLSVWNEYQRTDEFKGTWNMNADKTSPDYPNIRKKFRIWRTDIPRAKKDSTNRFGLDRIRNPWIYLKLEKKAGDFNRCIMQLHDIAVRYFTVE